MKIILTGGGTAGHISPAIAIAEEIKKRDKASDILFIGREGGRENEPIINGKFSLTTLKVKGIERKITVRNVENIFLALKAENMAKKIIKDFAPDVIVGTGGYVCWPVLRAGQKLKIPTAIHESNLVPGLVTRILEKRCDLTLLNLSGTAEYLKHREKSAVVGNPLRSGFGTVKRDAARQILGLKSDEIQIVSFGGSIGADKMNDIIFQVIKNYSSKNRLIKHIHGTGARYFEKYRDTEFAHGTGGCKILPYIDDMPLYLAAADIAICRCGAMTLSELAFLGVPSILIPSPNVTDNHQYKNGKYLAEKGAAVLIEEKALDDKELIKAVDRLVKSPEERKAIRRRIIRIANPNSTTVVTDKIFGIIR